jgi:hypothetical protein
LSKNGICISDVYAATTLASTLRMQRVVRVNCRLLIISKMKRKGGSSADSSGDQGWEERGFAHIYEESLSTSLPSEVRQESSSSGGIHALPPPLGKLLALKGDKLVGA